MLKTFHVMSGKSYFGLWAPRCLRHSPLEKRVVFVHVISSQGRLDEAFSAFLNFQQTEAPALDPQRLRGWGPASALQRGTVSLPPSSLEKA